jgi:hypothetical protein
MRRGVLTLAGPGPSGDVPSTDATKSGGTEYFPGAAFSFWMEDDNVAANLPGLYGDAAALCKSGPAPLLLSLEGPTDAHVHNRVCSRTFARQRGLLCANVEIPAHGEDVRAGEGRGGLPAWSSRLADRESEPRVATKWQVGPEVGPTAAVYRCTPTGMHGPACIVSGQSDTALAEDIAAHAAARVWPPRDPYPRELFSGPRRWLLL